MPGITYPYVCCAIWGGQPSASAHIQLIAFDQFANGEILIGQWPRCAHCFRRATSGWRWRHTRTQKKNMKNYFHLSKHYFDTKRQEQLLSRNKLTDISINLVQWFRFAILSKDLRERNLRFNSFSIYSDRSWCDGKTSHGAEGKILLTELFWCVSWVKRSPLL